MKVLMVNKFHYIKGGSETYYFALKDKLEEEGHSVIDFSMKDEKNFPSNYSEYFVENVDYSKKGSSMLSKLKMAINIIYSSEAKRKFEALVKKEKPDIVHLHIFQHQISPSILDITKKYNIPTVYTAHDLKMICPNYKMMHHNMICEECKNGHYYYCAINKCVKESLGKSCINVIEAYFHKWRKSYESINAIITPSDFYRKKFIEFGVAENKVHHVANFLIDKAPKVNKRSDCKNYYLYFGRLSEEKGIFTLINAMKKMNFNLYVVGTGPLEQSLINYIHKNKLNHIKLLGFKKGQELIDLVGNARAIIIPSEWYENGPYSAIEALQLGRPLIGASIGGIPELINGNGYLFTSGDVDDLKSKIEYMNQLSEQEYLKMEENSIKIFNDSYTWNEHYNKISRIYKEVLEG